MASAGSVTPVEQQAALAAKLHEVHKVLDAEEKAQILYAAVFAVVMYDYFSTMHLEVSAIWHAKRSFLKYLYLWVRYVGMVISCIIFSSFYAPWTVSNCSKLIHVVNFLPAVQLLPAQVILILRVYAVWDCSKTILALATALMCGEVVITAWTSWTQATHVPFIMETGPCLPMATSKVATLYFFSMMWTDLILTVLIVYKCLANRKHLRDTVQGPTVTEVVLKQSLHYFAIISIVNTVNALWCVLNGTLSLLLAPLAVAVTKLFALHLALAFKSDFFVSGRSLKGSSGQWSLQVSERSLNSGSNGFKMPEDTQDSGYYNGPHPSRDIPDIQKDLELYDISPKSQTYSTGQ